MKNTLIAGFVPLIDAAPFIVAFEKGFARDVDITLKLARQPSWAGLRDHLNLGHLDCAHALAPMPLATAIGIRQVRAPLIVPLVTSRGGNAITVSTSLAQRMRESAESSIYGARGSAAALAQVIRDSSDTLTFGMVYPYSGHNFEIRYWLAMAGIHPDRDVRLVAIPPPLMVESLKAGQVDGFCVGEPWNSVAVHQGFGEVVATKAEIFPHGIEKVLALPERALNDGPRLRALVASLHRAALWCDDPANRDELVELLSQRIYLNLPQAMLAQSLAGEIPGTDGRPNSDFLYFARNGAGLPHVSEALWLYAQMRRWGLLPDSQELEATVRSVFRPDLFEASVEDSQTQPAIAACDGVEFDGGSVGRYLERFSLFTPFSVLPDPNA